MLADIAHKKLRPLRGRSYQKLRPSCVHMWTGTLLGHAMMYIYVCVAAYVDLDDLFVPRAMHHTIRISARATTVCGMCTYATICV